MKYDIMALGEILIDFIPDGFDETGDIRFIRKAGGAPLNFLATAAKHGKKTALIGKVGNDMFGKYLSKVLTDNKICNNFLSFDKTHNTTLAFVSLDQNGERDFSFYRNYGADICLNKQDIDKAKFYETHIFHFGSLSSVTPGAAAITDYAVAKAESDGCIITYDPNYRAPLWRNASDAVKCIKHNLSYANIVKLSREEAEMITNEQDAKTSATEIMKYGPKIVLITDGAYGVTYRTASLCGFVPSLKVKAIDTTGAGDIFFGTFISEYLNLGKQNFELSKNEMERLVSRAVEISGKSTLKHGAIASIPNM